jgi:hypothetical protein
MPNPKKSKGRGKKGKGGKAKKEPAQAKTANAEVDRLAQDMMTAMSVGGDKGRKESPKWKHFDAGGRGFNLYSPDSYAPSLKGVGILIVLDHPIDYGLYGGRPRTVQSWSRWTFR